MMVRNSRFASMSGVSHWLDRIVKRVYNKNVVKLCVLFRVTKHTAGSGEYCSQRPDERI